MPEIRFTQDDRRILDRSLRIIDEQLERELGNIPSWLTDEDIETIRGLLYRQITPYAATFLGIVATAKTVVDECGGLVEGLPSFVDQAMWAVYELSGSIEVPRSIFDSAEKTTSCRMRSMRFAKRSERTWTSRPSHRPNALGPMG